MQLYPLGAAVKAQGILNQDRVIDIQPRYTAKPQPVEERRWADVRLKKHFTVSKGDNYFLYGGWEVDTDSMGNFYFLDREDRRVKKFDGHGNFLHSIGAGRGAGPAEFQWPIDFAVAPDGEVWIIDSHRRKLSRFAPDGSLTKSFQLNGTSATKSIALTNTGTAIILAHGPNPLFREWTASGSLVNQFGTLIQELGAGSFAFDGMVRAGSNGFVFAPNRAGHLVRYRPDSTLKYAVQTMDDIPYPDIRVSTDGVLSASIEPRRRLSTLDLSVVDDKIYCYSSPASSSETRVLDVYRYQDGTYLYSFELPIAFKKFGLTENYLMEVNPGQLTVWRWDLETEP